MNPSCSIGRASRFTAGIAAALGLALFFGASAPSDGYSGHAVMHLTFSQAVSLPGAVLPAGVYTFEALRPDLVRVTSRDGRRVFYTGFTHSVPRPAGLGRDVSVTLGEAPAGQPLPISRWYPEQRGRGHQFIW